MSLLRAQIQLPGLLFLALLFQSSLPVLGQYDQVATYTRGSTVMYYTFTTPTASFGALPTGSIPDAAAYWSSVHSSDASTETAGAKDKGSNSEAATLRRARLYELGWTVLTVTTSILVGLAAVLIV